MALAITITRDNLVTIKLPDGRVVIVELSALNPRGSAKILVHADRDIKIDWRDR